MVHGMLVLHDRNSAFDDVTPVKQSSAPAKPLSLEQEARDLGISVRHYENLIGIAHSDIKNRTFLL